MMTDGYNIIRQGKARTFREAIQNLPHAEQMFYDEYAEEAGGRFHMQRLREADFFNPNRTPVQRELAFDRAFLVPLETARREKLNRWNDRRERHARPYNNFGPLDDESYEGY